jgi:hypothetical protein
MFIRCVINGLRQRLSVDTKKYEGAKILMWSGFAPHNSNVERIRSTYAVCPASGTKSSQWRQCCRRKEFARHGHTLHNQGIALPCLCCGTSTATAAGTPQDTQGFAEGDHQAGSPASSPATLCELAQRSQRFHKTSAKTSLQVIDSTQAH